jgi:hypothetical protein
MDFSILLCHAAFFFSKFSYRRSGERVLAPLAPVVTGVAGRDTTEGGGDITPSSGVVDALARVLDLDPRERTHLFHLAGVVEDPAG